MAVSHDVDDGVEPRKHVVLSKDQRQAVLHALLTRLRGDGRPQRGAFDEVPEDFGIHWKPASRVWSQAQQSLSEGAMAPGIDLAVRLQAGRPKFKMF